MSLDSHTTVDDGEERWNIGNVTFYEVKSLVQYLKGTGAHLKSLSTQYGFGPLADIASSINRTLEQLMKGLAIIEECCEFEYRAKINEEVARARFPNQPELLQRLSQLTQVLTTGPGIFKVKPRDMDEKLADLNALAQIYKIKDKGTWSLHARQGWLADLVGFHGDPPQCACNLVRKLEDEELVVLNKHIIKGISFEGTPPAVWCQPGRLLLPPITGMGKPVLIQVDLVCALPPHPDYYRSREKRLPGKGKGGLVALPGGNS